MVKALNSLSRLEILGITVFSILAIVWVGIVTFDAISKTRNRSDSKIENAITEPATILVHVAGAVENPGLKELPIDGRVKDAISLAGGTVMDADTSILNLAEILKDGQKLYVPLIDEKIEFPLISEDENLKSLKARESGVKFPINLNTATEMELKSLPGVGDVRAKDIIDYRNRNGRFKNKSEIMNVKGIGDGTFENIKDLIYI